MYAFIPDAGFVGTAFANSMSNLLVTMGRNPCLVVACQNGPLQKEKKKSEDCCLVTTKSVLIF